MISLTSLMFISVTLFSIGALGVISRRNTIVIYISIEIMLNAINLMLVSLSKYSHTLNGQIITIMIVAVCAAEAALFLSLIVLLYRRKATLDSDKFTALSQNRDVSHG